MGLDYDGLNGPPPPPGVDTKKRDAGEARAEQLKARQRAFPSVVIDLANLVMNPGRPRRGWPESTVERVGLLAEDHAAVTAVMQKRKLLHEAPSPTAVVPIVVLSYHLARRLGKLTRRRRNQRAFIVDATLDVEAKLERWGNGEDFLPEQDQDAWAYNWGVAGGQLEAAVEYADKVLRGARPADLPMEQPVRQNGFVINLKTAKALGLYGWWN